MWWLDLNESSLLWALLEWGTVKVVFSGFRPYLVEKRDLVLDSEGSTFVINQKRISNEYYQEKLFMLKFWQCFKYIASKLEDFCQFFQISIIFHPWSSRFPKIRDCGDNFYVEGQEIWRIQTAIRVYCSAIYHAFAHIYSRTPKKINPSKKVVGL